MKEIEFDESQLSNIKDIGAKLFQDEKDPTSIFYKRVLVRPHISWLKISLYVLLPLVVAFTFKMLTIKYNLMDSNATNIIIVLGLIAYIIINAKKGIICLVHIYQRYSPDSIRNKCRFEPSCSQYMIKSVEKYGVIKGVLKGINRLRRCNISNGGFDEP